MIRYREEIFIRYGTIYSHKSTYPLVKVREIRRHEHFNMTGKETVNDIAILILDKSIKPTKDVGYAKLAGFDFNDQQTVIVYGWSGSDFYEPSNPILRKTEMIVRPAWECVKLNKIECPSVSNCRIMCAAGKFWGPAAGDSGGPVFLPDNTLVGIVSSNFATLYFVAPPWEEAKFVKVFHRLDFITSKEKYAVKQLIHHNPRRNSQNKHSNCHIL